MGGAGGSFEAGEKLVMAIVDDIVNVDGGCVAVVSVDVSPVAVSSSGVVCVTVLAVVVKVV
jgi:hypothetical protein